MSLAVKVLTLPTSKSRPEDSQTDEGGNTMPGRNNKKKVKKRVSVNDKTFENTEANGETGCVLARRISRV